MAIYLGDKEVSGGGSGGGLTGYILVDFARISYATSGTIADSTTATIDITIPNYNAEYEYIVIPQTSNYGNVYGYSRSGAIVTLNVINISGGTHSVSGHVYSLALKQL